jgi:adenylate kinase
VEELIKDKYAHGVVVDGFPRTVVQAECIKLLYDKLQQMWDSCKTNPHLRHVFRRPNFSICVLYVDENESVRRQMKRGRELQSYNRMVEDTVRCLRVAKSLALKGV